MLAAFHIRNQRLFISQPVSKTPFIKVILRAYLSEGIDCLKVATHAPAMQCYTENKILRAIAYLQQPVLLKKTMPDRHVAEGFFHCSFVGRELSVQSLHHTCVWFLRSRIAVFTEILYLGEQQQRCVTPPLDILFQDE